MTSNKLALTKEEKKLCNKLWFSFNFCRLLGNKINSNGCGFLFGIEPALKQFYGEDTEEYREACLRNIEIFNSHSLFCHFLGGVTAGMEKQKSEGKCDGESISKVKMSLMGPLAGIGDSFFYTCFRVIIAGIAMGFCATGSILGPILFILLHSGPQIFMKWYAIRLGYISGSSLVEKAFESGILPLITRCFGYVGMAMLGVMIATNVKINIAWQPTINGAVTNIQGMLDTIFPGLLSLVLFGIVYNLIKKKVNPITIVFVIMGISILLAWLGIF